MIQRLFTTTAIAMFLSGAALAQGEVQSMPTAPLPPAPPAAASDDSTPAAVAPAIISSQEDSQIRVGELVGMSVTDTGGEIVGSIDDVILDKDGKVAGLVVATGGFFGIGAKRVGISWTDVQVDADAQAVEIGVSDTQLAEAPAFKTKAEILAEEAASQVNAPPPAAPQSGTATPP